MDELKVTKVDITSLQPIINEKKPHTDVYAWEAIYNDETWLREWAFISNGQRIIAARYCDIQRHKLVAMNLYRSDKLPDDPKKAQKGEEVPALVVEIQSGYRLILRKKRRQRAIGLQTPFLTIYLIGWQATINDRNVQSIIYLYHDESKPDTKDDIQVLSGGKTDDELLKFELYDFELETP